MLPGRLKELNKETLKNGIVWEFFPNALGNERRRRHLTRKDCLSLQRSSGGVGELRTGKGGRWT